MVHAPQIASLLDVAPTLADLAGVSASSEWQGRSLLSPIPRIARFFTDQALLQVGLRDGPWKFIDEVDSGRARLFDLRTDPGELRNVEGDQRERVELYRRHLAAWRARQRALVAR